MRFFTWQQILLSCLLAALFGVGCGLFQQALRTFACGFRAFLLLPKNALSSARQFSVSRIRDLSEKSVEASLGGVALNLTDFIDWMVFGLGFLLVSYATLDGILRLYTLGIALALRWLSLKSIGDILAKIARFLFVRVYFLTVLWLALSMFPMVRIALILYRKCLRPIACRIRLCKLSRISKRIERKKLDEIGSIFLFEKTV